MRPCRPGGGTGCAAGRARRPRRAARRGTRTLCARGRPCAHGDVPVDAGRRGRRPLPCDIKPTHGYSRNFHVSGGYRIVVTFRGNLTPYQTFSYFIECPRHPSNPFSVFCGGEAVLCVLCRSGPACRASEPHQPLPKPADAKHLRSVDGRDKRVPPISRRTRQARPSRFPADATSASLPFPGGRDKRVPPVSPPRYTRPSCF